MKNVKDYKNRVIDCFKTVFNNYRFTFLVLFLITLLLVLLGTDSNSVNSFIEVLVLYFVVLFAIESFVKDKTWKVIFYIIGFVFALVCHIFFTSHELFMFGIFSSLGLLSLFKIVRDRKEDIDNYLLNVFQNELIFGVISFIILVGVMFIAFIIHSLLISSVTVNLFERLFVLWFGVVFVPGEIVCLHYIHKDIFPAVKVIVKYIMYPLVLLATGILFIYLLKILIVHEVPSNTLYSIIMWTIWGGLFLYIILFKRETGISKKILSVLPYLFAILVLVQSYSLYLRVNAYGITEMRYIGWIIILIELVVLVLIILEKFEWLKYVLLLMIAFSLMAYSLPFVNMRSVSVNNQVKRIVGIYKEGSSFDDYSDKEKGLIRSAYWYLNSHHELGRLPAYVNLSSIRGYTGNIDNLKELNYYNDSREIPIDNYKYLVEVVMDEEYTEAVEISSLSYNMFHDVEGLEEGIKVFLDTVMSSGSVDVKNIHFKDSSSYYIKKLVLIYDEDSHKIQYINMEGYLLKH